MTGVALQGGSGRTAARPGGAAGGSPTIIPRPSARDAQLAAPPTMLACPPIYAAILPSGCTSDHAPFGSNLEIFDPVRGAVPGVTGPRPVIRGCYRWR